MNFDINKSKQTLVDACHNTIGDDLILRTAFNVHFPHLLKLRNAGFSFEQITELLEQCELNLHCSMVEQYFEDRLMEKIFNETNQNQDRVVAEKVVSVTPTGMQHTTASAPIEGLHCLALLPVKPLKRRDDLPEEVYMDGQLEHPAILGLMLTKDERLYGKQLEVVDQNGGIDFETVQEMAFRVKWMKPIPRTETASGASFVKMNYELFKYVGK